MTKRSEVSETSSGFLEAMQEGAEIMLGQRPPARAWMAPATVDVRAIRRGTG